MTQKTTTTPTQTPSVKEILSEIARIEWAESGNQGEAPVPTLRDLFSVSSELFQIEAPGFLNTLTALKEEEAPLNRFLQSVSLLRQAATGDVSIGDVIIGDVITDLHALWLYARDRIEIFYEECEKKSSPLIHPLAPLIRAWLKDQIPKIEPERRKDTGILHDKIKNTFPSPRLPLRIAETAPAEPEQMVLINNLPQGEEQLELPGFIFPETELVPALPLVAYENAGGKLKQPGRGAPIEQRLFVNVLVEYEQKQRGQHNLSRLFTTYRDVKSWLYPNGSTDSKKVLIPRLRQGMWNLHNLWFLWERRDWNIISVDTLPTMNTKPDDPLSFTIRMPMGMNTSNGVLIGIEPLRLYGAQSAPKFRAWVRLAYLWDAAKIRNGGKRIYATIPKVQRNSDGYLVDAKGEVICTGKLRRTKGGWTFQQGNIPQTAWYHPLAIHMGGTDDNPQADEVPILSDSDMVKLFYDHTERKDETFRKALLEARRHALEMEAEGRIVVKTDQIDKKTGIKGWRILEPYTD